MTDDLFYNNATQAIRLLYFPTSPANLFRAINIICRVSLRKNMPPLDVCKTFFPAYITEHEMSILSSLCDGFVANWSEDSLYEGYNLKLSQLKDEFVRLLPDRLPF
jgi:hypothetical protein